MNNFLVNKPQIDTTKIKPGQAVGLLQNHGNRNGTLGGDQTSYKKCLVIEVYPLKIVLVSVVIVDKIPEDNYTKTIEIDIDQLVSGEYKIEKLLPVDDTPKNA